MEKVVKIRSGFKCIEHSSIHEAINLAKIISDPRKSECGLINKQVVTGYQFDGIFLVISFENNLHLTVSPSEDRIKWNVVTEKPNIGTVPLEKVYFELSSGVKFLWNWQSILNNFVGKQIIIAPSDQYLFIYRKDGIEFMFSYYVNTENSDDQYLSISEA